MYVRSPSGAEKGSLSGGMAVPSRKPGHTLFLLADPAYQKYDSCSQVSISLLPALVTDLL
jgi:hypothetical protein